MSGVDDPRTSEDPFAELTASYTETLRVLFSAGGVAETLKAVVNLAVETIAGCDVAGIFILAGDAVTTPTLTDPIVAEVDSVQHRLGEGPCLDAIGQGGSFYAGDLSTDTRWPSFGPEACAIGIRSALAFNLTATDILGALNLYARGSNAFGVDDRAKGLILASLASLALASAEVHAEETRRFDNLQGALVSREVIGQAQGILIEREHITADQAFAILRRASQHLNMKVRDVAQALVDTGERPETGSEPPSV